MGGLKRKGYPSGAANVLAVYRPPAVSSKRSRSAVYLSNQRMFVPGRDRSGGFYGRFSGRGGELKFLDTTLNFAFDATIEVPVTGQLSLIPQGVTESTRIGRKCTLRSIQIRAKLNLVPAASALSSAVTYLYLVQDKQANGAAATASGTTGVFTSADASAGMFNLSESNRFIIHKRWTMDHNPPAGVSTAFNTVTHHIEFYKKLSIPMEYTGTTGAIGTIRSNNLFFVSGSSGAGTFDDLVTMTGTCRVRFSDA